MTDEEIKALEDKCTLKTKEQFVEACRKAGISEDWYAFSNDRIKPVCIGEKEVLYGKGGKTIVLYPFQLWDTAYEELLKYKDLYDTFIKEGTKFRIDDVRWSSDVQIVAGRSNGYPYVTLRHVEFSEEPDPSLLEKGWIYDGYDHYMGYSNYYKNVNIKNLAGEIVVEFTKLTDDRDRIEFGFTDAYMCGSYRYPVPAELKERILYNFHFNGQLSGQLKDELKQRFSKKLLEDEFHALVRLRDDHLRALLDAIDSRLTEKEQKQAFADAGNAVEYGNPASENLYGSRCYVVTHKNFDIAYRRAGIRG